MLSDTEKCHLREAEGWLELGMAKESARELDQIGAANQCDRQVLAVRMSVQYHLSEWAQCLETAKTLAALSPDTPWAYVNGSIALYRLGRTQEAWDFLLPVFDKFPENWTVPYNLACYAAQLGKRDDALRMFGVARDRADPKQLKTLALEDKDLEPIWDAITAQ
jgi:predicted Zn-dependent protease